MRRRGSQPKLAKWCQSRGAAEHREGEYVLQLANVTVATVLERWPAAACNNPMDLAGNILTSAQDHCDDVEAKTAYEVVWHPKAGEPDGTTMTPLRLHPTGGTEEDSELVQVVKELRRQNKEAYDQMIRSTELVLSQQAAFSQQLIERVSKLEGERGSLLEENREHMEAAVMMAAEDTSEENAHQTEIMGKGVSLLSDFMDFQKGEFVKKHLESEAKKAAAARAEELKKAAMNATGKEVRPPKPKPKTQAQPKPKPQAQPGRTPGPGVSSTPAQPQPQPKPSTDRGATDPSGGSDA